MRLEAKKPLDANKQLSVSGVSQQAAVGKAHSEVDAGARVAEEAIPYEAIKVAGPPCRVLEPKFAQSILVDERKRRR